MANNDWKSHAKINIFLKITGRRGSYHELLSRFVRLPDLYDVMHVEMEQCPELTIEGNFSCEKEKNSIFVAYRTLLKFVHDPHKLRIFFKNHKIKVNKQIKENGGLGGGSSNAATFLRMANEMCRLGMSTTELTHIGSKVGADVPFFVHDIASANIKGIGEIVEPFEERVPPLKLLTPNICCNTADVYMFYRKFCYQEAKSDILENLERMESCEILKSFSGKVANDLCQPTIAIYPEMSDYIKDEWFMSGSGSTVFCLDRS